MTSTTTTINEHFDLDVLRSSLAETEQNCALFCEKFQNNNHRRFEKHSKVNVSPIVSMMNTSNQFISDESDSFNEKSDGCKTITTESFCTFQKSGHNNAPNGPTSKNDNMTTIDRSKPFVPPKQVLMYLVRMGSFTSMSKIVPATDTDKDIEHEFRQLKNVETLNKTRKDRDIEFSSLDNFLKHCTERLIGLPEPISRNWKKSTTGVNSLIDHTNSRACEVHQKEENVRVLQWNVLSQTLGTKNDNFVRCPKPALEWRTRRFRMLEEIARHDADVICLQEVDHFPLVKEALACLGYDGHFFPKPDSPCLYLPENSGPDGCAIFYKTNKFDLERVESRVIEVWCVQSNQVVLSTVLKSKTTQAKIVIATTHLKARNGALLSTLRNEQGKDLLAYLEKVSCHGKIPVICTGDFNAEPTEPVYQTITDGTDNISFQSAYAETTITDEAQPDTQKEAKYTTWKIREDGEHIQTLDYIFYHSPYNTTANTDLSSDNDEESNNMYNESIENNVKSKSHPVCNQIQVEKVLDFPTGDQISVDRIPSFSYASDHFSLLADFKLKSVISESEE